MPCAQIDSIIIAQSAPPCMIEKKAMRLVNYAIQVVAYLANNLHIRMTGSFISRRNVTQYSLKIILFRRPSDWLTASRNVDNALCLYALDLPPFHLRHPDGKFVFPFYFFSTGTRDVCLLWWTVRSFFSSIEPYCHVCMLRAPRGNGAHVFSAFAPEWAQWACEICIGP